MYKINANFQFNQFQLADLCRKTELQLELNNYEEPQLYYEYTN